jgi:hypothetical protein
LGIPIAYPVSVFWHLIIARLPRSVYLAIDVARKHLRKSVDGADEIPQ